MPSPGDPGGRRPPWDPFGFGESVRRPLASLSQLAPVPGFTTLVQPLVKLAKRRLVGRRIRVRTQATDLTLTLTGLDVPLDALGVPVGQLDDVRLSATDVSWHGHRADRVTATLRNVHTRPGTTPTLVAAPVDLTVSLPPATVVELVRAARPELQVGWDRDAAFIGWGEWDWLRLECSPTVDGTCVLFRPVALVVAGRRFPGLRLVPPVAVPLALPDAVRLLRLELRDDGVDVRVRVDQWKVPFTTRAQEELVRRLSSASSVLDLSRWPFG